MSSHQIGSADGVRAEILERGATLQRLWVPTAGGPRNVVLGHRLVQEYDDSSAFFGGTIGRVANRIAGATLMLDGTYALDANESGHTLHGGAGGFDTCAWTVRDVRSDSVTLAMLSPDGDQGFPGALTATVRYTVRADGLDIDLSATTTAATVVSLTNHSYVNLDGEGSGSVEDHLLSVAADHYTPTDDRLIPTGEIAPVDGTPLDLRRPRRIGDVVRDPHPVLAAARGVDHNLVLRGSGVREIAVVTGRDLELRVDSDAPGLQVYTGNFLDGSAIGTGGRRYRQGDGLALEPQSHPDTPHHEAFGTVRLEPGQTHRRTIRWTFASPR